MGVEGIEELGESAGEGADEAAQPQPGADTPTETTDPDVPGEEPVQVEGPGVAADPVQAEDPAEAPATPDPEDAP